MPHTLSPATHVPAITDPETVKLLTRIRLTTEPCSFSKTHHKPAHTEEDEPPFPHKARRTSTKDPPDRLARIRVRLGSVASRLLPCRRILPHEPYRSETNAHRGNSPLGRWPRRPSSACSVSATWFPPQDAAATWVGFMGATDPEPPQRRQPTGHSTPPSDRERVARSCLPSAQHPAGDSPRARG